MLDATGWLEAYADYVRSDVAETPGLSVSEAVDGRLAFMSRDERRALWDWCSRNHVGLPISPRIEIPGGATPDKIELAYLKCVIVGRVDPTGEDSANVGVVPEADS